MRRLARILVTSFFATIIFSAPAFSQCPAAGFSSLGAVCAGQPVNLNNSTTGGVSYYWDFCGGDFSSATLITRDTLSGSTGPIAATPVFDGTNWFAFITSDDGSITRLEYSNSLSNIPVATNLGNIGAAIAAPVRNNLSIIQYNGNWYGFLACQGNSELIRYDFGASLTTTPTAVPSSPYTELGGAYFQCLVNDNGHYYLFVTRFSSLITVFDLGTDPTAAPTVSTLTLASGTISAMSFEKICDNWYGFAADYNGSIVRLDFGTSLLNASPTANTVATGLSYPISLVTAFDGKDWNVFTESNGNTGIYQLNFGNDLLNTAPSAAVMTLTGFTSIGLSVSIAKDLSAFYLFSISYGANSYGMVKLESPCSATPSTSTQTTPAGIIYSSGGTYWASLFSSDGSGNTDYFSDTLVISYAPNTGFTATGLCLGDATQFTDTSSLSVGTITQWHWDFGDTDTSNLQNDTHTYAASSNYTVILTAYASSGCSSSATMNIDITPRPVASFTLPNGCSDALLPFTDNSTIPAGTISNWLWTFGNGDSSTTQHPFYGFPDGGNFNVTLLVTSAAGCTDDTTYSLNISPSPDAAFSTTNTCVGQAVIFTDETVSQVSVTSYEWHFGEGGTSSLPSPTYTYSTGVPATYIDTLIVTAANSCSDTLIVPVHISNVPTANFVYSPSNACQGNVVSFTDLSTGNGDTISAWSWDFGDSNIDSVMNPGHTFAAYDTFHVSLIAYSPSSCPSAPYSQDIIVIQSPIANFGYNEVCLGDPTPFTDLSVAPNGSSITSRMWRFDDGDSSQLTNPLHTFATDGNHQVILTVTTNFGCTGSDTVNVAVHAHPHAAFVYQNSCTDYPTIFTSNSAADSASYIATYDWNFGDPGSADNTSSLQNPLHIYDSSSVGLHNVFLIVVNNFGCRDSVFQTIDVNFSVIPNFTYSPTCLGDIMSFTNFSGNANLDSTWTWNFGDQQTISIENPAHYYVYAGTYTVTLTALSVDGCISSASKDVVVSGIPVANFSTLPACIHAPYQFIDNSTVSNGTITRWKWTIDTLATDTVQNPVYTFDTTGTYAVKLVVYSDIGCVDSISQNVTVHPLPVPNFSYSPQYGNPPLTVNFNNLTDLLGQCTYSWSFGDNTQGSTLTNPQHIYQDTGRYSIQLIAVSSFGCVDSISKGIYVIKPVLDAAVTHVSATLVNGQLGIQASIANLGTVDIDSVIMQAQLQDGTVIQETYHQLLPNGSNGIQSYDFVASFNIPPSSSVAFYCVSVIKPNGRDDDVPENNEKCSSLNNEFSIMEPFPNPFSDFLQMNVILPYDDYLTVEMFNNLGQKLSTIYDAQGTTGLNLIQVDFSSLADGLYTLRFSFRDQVIVRKVAKDRVKK